MEEEEDDDESVLLVVLPKVVLLSGFVVVVLPYLDIANCVVVMDGRAALLLFVVVGLDEDAMVEEEVEDSKLCCNAS